METSEETEVTRDDAATTLLKGPVEALVTAHPWSPTVRAWSILATIVAAAAVASVLFVTTTRDTPATRSSPAPAAPGAAASNLGSGAMTVSLSDFKVKASAATIPAGQFTLTINNEGSIQHELLVFRSGLAPNQYPQENGEINEDGPGIAKVSDGDNIDPGASQTRTVDLTTPGTYLFVCNLPGHFAAGMYETITVK
jgi:uncharacterized cupredoxin-like copper-binding protein